jgi:hypothetical protein
MIKQKKEYPDHFGVQEVQVPNELREIILLVAVLWQLVSLPHHCLL